VVVVVVVVAHHEIAGAEQERGDRPAKQGPGAKRWSAQRIMRWPKATEKPM